MRYAIDICPLGDLADPRQVVRLAVAAEAAGWDGLSIWDSLGASMDTAAADPFVTLTAVASAAPTLRLITSVLALPRRRPQLVAQSAATLDRWSDGRLVLGVGSGGDPGDFEPYGEPFDSGQRARALDVALEQIDGYLRGEGGPRIGPQCIQEPRPPIWIGGMRPGALRRAAHWDGWIANGVSDDGASMVIAPPGLAELIARVTAERLNLGRAGRFDVAFFGFCEPEQATVVGEIAAAGATWWLESLSPMRGTIDALIERVAVGPPRP